MRETPVVIVGALMGVLKNELSELRFVRLCLAPLTDHSASWVWEIAKDMLELMTAQR